MILSKDTVQKYWDKFLKSGRIEDYISYKIQSRRLEEGFNEEDRQESGARFKNE